MKDLKIKGNLAKATEALSDVEFGRLIRGMLQYASSGEEPQLSGSERILWPTAKEDVDQQIDSYAAKCKRIEIARGQISVNNQSNISLKSVNNQSEVRLKREESEKEERPKETPQKKSSPPDPLVKENTPEKSPGEERGREEKQSARVKSTAEEAFDMFWAVYPKKVGKKDAFKAFQKVPASDYPLLIPAVEQQKQSRQWQSEGGRFIPNPSTWLNQGRWLDEGLDAGFNAPRKNRVAQELDDFYDMAREWAEEQKARAAGDI